MKRLALIVACMWGLNVSVQAQEANNTAENKESARPNAITAEKQPNKKHDVRALARIRRNIVREKGLSMDAKNVKILYSDGAVTLKGPVDSNAERARVEDIARNCGGVTSVQNLMTITPGKQ
ncbi:MAG TPA: BON domain-containing protein [Oculatellaceae cyanobacterium]